MEWYASRRLNGDVDLSSNLDSRHPATRAFAERDGLRLWHNRAMDRPVFACVTRSPEQAVWRYTWYRDAIASEQTVSFTNAVALKASGTATGPAVATVTVAGGLRAPAASRAR